MQPVILWGSFSIAIIGSVFVNLMTRAMKHTDHWNGADTNENNSNFQNCQALYAMAVLGIGETLGGNLIGLLRDKVNNKVAIVMQLLLCMAALFSVYLFNRLNQFTGLAHLMCFLWGLQDSGINCLVRSMLGFEFDSKIVPYSVFNFSHSVYVFVAQLVEVKVMDESGTPQE